MCGLALTCVFAKQSLGPIICDRSEPATRGRQPQSASLLPKLRDHYAEFLDPVSLVHLSYSPRPPVSVCGTDVCSIPHQGFSCLSTLRDSRLGCPAHSSQVSVSLHPFTAIHKAARASFQGPPGVANTLQTGPEYSPAVHRLRLWGLALGSASPCADCHGAGILGLTVCGVLTRICAYSIRHPLF